MGKDSSISWTDHTFSPWWGCTKISPGCEHCYADSFSQRVGHGKRLPMIWGPRAERRFMSDAHWREPVKWNRAAEKAGKRARVFCASMADVFEDRRDLLEARARLWTLVGMTPHLDWLLLTKRPENAQRLWSAAARAVELAEIDQSILVWNSNVWLGTTCEDQRRANERLPHLLAVPAAVRFVSYEPAIGPVDFTRIVERERPGPPFPASVEFDALRGFCGSTPDRDTPAVNGLDWIIVGGESGPGARPFDLAWMRSTINQCKAAGVAVFVKQLGANAHDYRRTAEWAVACNVPVDAAAHFTSAMLSDRKGGDWDEWPEDLRVREWPR